MKLVYKLYLKVMWPKLKKNLYALLNFHIFSPYQMQAAQAQGSGLREKSTSTPPAPQTHTHATPDFYI